MAVDEAKRRCSEGVGGTGGTYYANRYSLAHPPPAVTHAATEERSIGRETRHRVTASG